MLALPHTFRNTKASNGTSVKLTVTTDIGDSWFLIRSDDKWILSKQYSQEPTTEIVIDPDTAWKLFSKSLRPEHVMDKIKISGDYKLGEIALTMVSVMA
jgi:hypothetical protein